MKHKLLFTLAAFLTAFCLMPFLGTSVYALSTSDVTNPTEISFGDTKSVSLNAGEVAWFSIKSSANATCIVDPSGDDATICRLYVVQDSQLNEVQGDMVDSCSDEREYELKADMQYYYRVAFYKSTTSGSITVKLSGQEVECSHYWREVSRDDGVSIDSTYHADVLCYECSKCGETRTEYINEEMHDLICDGYDYVRYSASKHKKLAHYKCLNCDFKKTATSYHDHSFYKYDTQRDYYSKSKHKTISYFKCSDCGFKKTTTSYYYHTFYKYNTKNKYYNTSKHKRIFYYACQYCDCTKTSVKYVKHTPERLTHSTSSGQYEYTSDACKYCNFPKIKSATLANGKWKGFSGRPYLKIVVDKPGYIKVYGNMYSFLYKSGKQELSNDFKYAWDNPKYFVVKPGTYYLRPDYDDSNSNFKVKYVFRSVPKQTNTSLSKAVTLKKNAVKSVVFHSSKSTQYRWYKIKVTSKRKISVYTYGTGYYGNLAYFDGIYKYHKKSSDDWKYRVADLTDVVYETPTYDKYVSDKKLKPGTYYVKVVDYGNPYAYTTLGHAYRIKWK